MIDLKFKDLLGTWDESTFVDGVGGQAEIDMKYSVLLNDVCQLQNGE
jgi:hypothetical protein